MNPLSAIYAGFVSGRNRLYDSHVLKQNRLCGPVISVGNLSVGGSGKTPFVILLGGLLQQRGVEFDVLSRGYGRASRGVLQVDPNGSPKQFGDEPLLIARKLGCPVIVGEKRYDAGLFAEQIFGPRLHILDDGFQHRALARDFDIVLLAQDDLRAQPLPAGRLREPLSSLRRADAIVMPSGMDLKASPAKLDWRIQRSLDVSNPPKRAVTFCAIARPQGFLDQLRVIGIEPVATKFYRDHHAYTSGDIKELLAIRDQSGATGYVTTEKDEINLGSQIKLLGPIAIARVGIQLEPADALDTMLRVIAERKPSP